MDGRFDIRFRIGPLPISIEPTFWLGVLLLGDIRDPSPRILVWAAVVLVSVLAHELGHALASLAFGVRSRIRLHLFGGLTLPERALPRWHDTLMSLAGPLAGFALGALSWLAGTALHVSERHLLWRYAYDYALWVNVVWSLFNLLPILPLDGGHVLLGVLGPKRYRWVLGAGGGIAAAGAIAAGLLQATGTLRENSYLILLFSLFAFRNLQAFFAAGSAVRGPTEAITLDQALARGWAALSNGQEEDANRFARMVLEHAPDPVNRNRARDLLAWTALASADARLALAQLERSEPPEAARPLTWAMVLDTLQEPARALPYALRAVEVEPSETTASLAVRLLATTGEAERAASLAQSFPWPRSGARQSSLGEVAFAQGAWAAATEHYVAAFGESGLASDAYNAACSHAKAGNRLEAHAWLRRALEAGLDDPGQILSDPDLASLKDDPELGSLVAGRHPG